MGYSMTGNKPDRNTADSIKAMLKGGAIYSFGNMLQQFLNFILIPVYTAFLTTGDYGIIGLMTITAGLILPFTKTPAANGFVRFYYSPGYENKRKTLFFNSVIFCLAQSFIIGLIFYLFSSFWAGLILSDISLDNIVKIYAIIIFLQPIEDLSQDLVKIQKKAGLFVVMQLLRLLLGAALILYLLLIANSGVMALVWGALFSSAWPVLFFMPLIAKNIEIKFDLNSLRPLLKFGYPLILTTLSLYLAEYADQYIIKFMAGISDAGLYSFAYKFGALTGFILVLPLHSIIDPLVYELESRKAELITFMKRATTLFYAAVLYFSVILSLLSKEVIHIFASKPEFYPAWEIVPLISFAYCHYGLMYLFGRGLIMAKKSKLTGLIYLISAVINIFMNIILIPVWGLTGAAVSTIISFILMGLLSAFYSAKYYNFKYDSKKLIILTLVYFAAVTPAYFSIADMITGLLIKSVIIIVFTVAAYYVIKKDL